MSRTFNHHFIHHDNIKVYKEDLPNDFSFSGDSVAIDTEAMGLNHIRDRLCLVQLCFGDDMAYLIQIAPNVNQPKNLIRLLEDSKIQKIFHYARFDIAILYKTFGILCQNVYCTKIASYLALTYTDRHGLKEVCRQLLGIELSKTESSSYWGASELSPEQKEYAAKDVLYLHKLRAELNKILKRENRLELLQKCLDFLPHRVELDIRGWEEHDIFSHSIKKD
ncbi:Ribonuclease D [Candidatus Gromoviella agglomerans]|nr:ribonuclease H-like domain-containing protein [Candidatus Gromoviella agglomerans]UFX98602.1 Ribonuclease D [Candidatus Gromoviella agglomerans]